MKNAPRDLGFRVQGSEFRVKGSGFRVETRRAPQGVLSSRQLAQHPTHGRPLHSQSPREQSKPGDVHGSVFGADLSWKSCGKLAYSVFGIRHLRFVTVREIVRETWRPTNKSLFGDEICYIPVSLAWFVAEN